ncbi:50S ribosomal protein L21 [bacterium]|nr:50S ribosomal protein L21 [candidate division CSSED10-310 bacterium]
MFAIIESGGKQYRVSKDTELKVEKLSGDAGEQIQLEKVLLINENNKISIGSPYIEGSVIKATILDQDRDRKIRVFKIKRRKRYRRAQGHRQSFTKIRIDEILHGRA